MRSGVRRVTGVALGALVVLILGTAGCRQPDGPLPQPGANKQGDITDVAKDLLNVVARADNATQELQDDLVKFADTPAGEGAARELSQRVTTAISGSKLTAAQAGEIAQQLYYAVAARQLSQRQAKAIREQVETLLKNAGVAEASASAVGDQLMSTQTAVTTVQKKWYQFF